MIPTEEGACNLARVLADEAEEIRLQCESRTREYADPKIRIECDLDFPPLGDNDNDKPSLFGGEKSPERKSPIPDRLGLAFSGGGIRSACVALGIVQRLAQARMLAQVHYISGISGGGYLLGWLTAWIRREGSLLSVEAQLGRSAACDPTSIPPDAVPSDDYKRFVEPDALHYLRRYSSYLTPRVGLVSGDTLAMASVYLRNLLLNQIMLAMAAVSAMLLLQLLSPKVFWAVPICHGLMYAALGVFVAVFAYTVWIAAESLQRLGTNQVPKENPYAAILTIGGGVVACFLIWWMTPSWYALFFSEAATLWTIAAVVVLGFAVSAWRFSQGDQLNAVERGAPSFFYLFLAWSTVGGLCALLDAAFRKWLIFGPTGHTAIYVGDSYTILGLPCLLVALALVSYAFLGILGSTFPDAKREWLARLAGYFLLFAAVIGGVVAVALRGPLLMHLLFTSWQLPSWKKYVISAVVPGGWLFVVLTGLIGAKSAKSSGTPAQTTKLDTVITIAPPVFLIGLLLVVSWGTHALVLRNTSVSRTYLTTADWRVTPAPQWCTACASSSITQLITAHSFGTPFERNTEPDSRSSWFSGYTWLYRWQTRYLLVWLLSTGGAFLLSVRLDVNEFSLHLFYRNRLVRAFLGASNNKASIAGKKAKDRTPSPFTGFALDDDIALSDLSHHPSNLYDKPYPGPYPIWGATLNMTAGEDLAWQQRKGASFIYSPLFCGWDYVDNPTGKPEPAELDTDDQAKANDDGMNRFGYRSTVGSGNAEGYGGRGGRPFIGTAMAASGAAVSPNMGYHTRPGVAALLAIFNLRLGWWTGNPRNPFYWKRYAPGIWYLLAELIGQTDDKSKYVYLSDGGHFENLGIYELVRRKTRFIICSDADADPEFSFADLGNAIDRCRRDFGVEIHIRAQRDVCAEGGKQFRSGHYAIGEICYPGQTARGILLYLKSSLTSDEPSDVLGMKASDSDFPHDSTANQFFNEAMFESYRALGEHMMDVILRNNEVSNQEASPRDAVAKLFTSLTAKADAQKKSDKEIKPPPLAVSIAGGITVHMDA